MRIGIDLGGSKIEAIALGDDGESLWRQRVATPNGDYHGIIGAIVGLVAQLERDLGRTGTVGIGTPGSLSAVDGTMKNCNSTVLNGRAFAIDLAHALHREVRLANDADCFTLSEASDGAARDAASVFGVILGTGVGGGLVVAKRLLAGPNAICGEWGHNPMPYPWGDDHVPRRCYCGRVDCIETWLCGPAFEKNYLEHCGVRRPAGDIAQRVACGEPGAVECYRNYVDMLARALATVINIFDPYAVVLGGGMSNVESLTGDVVQCWHQYVFSDRVDTRLLRAKYGDSSGVRGAAWLWH
jgi:fructokinase